MFDKINKKTKDIFDKYLIYHVVIKRKFCGISKEIRYFTFFC